jgi:hypothetical protein
MPFLEKIAPQGQPMPQINVDQMTSGAKNQNRRKQAGPKQTPPD